MSCEKAIDPYIENEESRKNKYKEEFADLKKLFDNKMYSDIKFKVEGEEIPAHKALLAAKCPYFERAFSSYFPNKLILTL